MARLTELPVELCVRILRDLPALEIVRFQQVSRSFLDFIRGSVELQYLVERFLAGVADVSPSPQHSLRDKLDRLRTWSDAWNGAKWTEQHVVPFRSAERHVSGPVIAFALGNSPRYRSISFYLTGSQSRGIAPRTWSIEDLDDFSMFAFDWYQDLLVLVSSDYQDGVAKLRLLTCSTGTSHPAAINPTLAIELSEEHNYELKYLYICGDLLGFRSSDTTSRSIELSVHDWKQDRLLMHIGVDERAIDSDDPVPDSYAFLDSRHVLVTTWGDEAEVQVMAVFDCRASATPRRVVFPEALQDSALLVLEMPRMTTRATRHESVMYKLFCAPNSPSALHAQTAGAAFRAAASPVVAICITANGLITEHCLLISGRFLLAQIARIHAQGAASSVVRIPWQAYAHECRIVERRPGKAVVHGARFATWADNPGDSTDGGSSEPLIRIWHFDEPAAVRRQAGLLDAEPGPGNASSDDMFPLPASDCVLETEDYSRGPSPCGSDTEGSNIGHSSDGSTAEGSRSDDSAHQIWREPMPLGAPHVTTWTDVQSNGARVFSLIEDGLVVLGGNHTEILTL
ncbi:F-box protein [Phanerochaete sordida]|uniref:F-box protein n=1 Tax=Phanerochaete sordida TaxID=48140 RepID=A0A9P3GDT8_9APHY|nr:F-box protein [Phanerochaete sordida]